MLAGIEGEIIRVAHDRAELRVTLGEGSLVYEVLLPAFLVARLGGRIGERVTLHTLHYLESHGQGQTMLPRLAGFASREDKAFFELFVTVKGIGYRKALRAMTMEVGQVAAAIADRDVKLLQTLPEIGRRTAETVVVTLRDKVDAFVSASAYPGGGAGVEEAAGAGGAGARGMARGALEVLLQLGENRVQAMAWIDAAMSGDDPPRDVEGLVAAVYRVKAGG